MHTRTRTHTQTHTHTPLLRLCLRTSWISCPVDAGFVHRFSRDPTRMSTRTCVSNDFTNLGGPAREWTPLDGRVPPGLWPYRAGSTLGTHWSSSIPLLFPGCYTSARVPARRVPALSSWARARHLRFRWSVPCCLPAPRASGDHVT